MGVKQYISILIIILAVSIRINVYVQNRSLIIDEANLARNIVEKNALDFFYPIDYDQYAPPLYLTSTKILTRFLGANEYSMKLISLLSGIGIILLLWSFLKFFKLKQISIWYILLLFAFSSLSIRYSTEFKQYSSDAFLCLLFIWYAFKEKEKELKWNRIIVWSLFGAIGIWASMPLIFILAAIGIGFLYQKNKSVNDLLKLSLLGGIWLTSFGIYFYFILNHDTKDREILNFHNRFFFSLTPSNFEDWNQNFKILQSFFRYSVEKTVVGNIWGLLMFVTGFYILLKDKTYELIILIMPILMAIIASHFQLFSMIPRVSLFIFPLLLVVIALGHTVIWNKSNKWVKYLLVAIMILTLINNEGYRYLYSKMEFENSKALFEVLKNEHKKEDLIYVQVDGVPAFVFYNEMHDNKYNLSNYFLGDVGDKLSPMSKENGNRHSGNFWLFLSHTFPQSEIDRYIAMAKLVGVEEKRFIREEASLYYFISHK